MAGNKTTPKSPVDTGNKTISGRTIWNDPETGKDYSERSTTFEIDGKYYTMPTVAKNGGQYTSDTIRDYVKENGPIDYITGEKLPEFRNREDAIEYAISRSSTRKQKDFTGMAKGGAVPMDNQMRMFEEGGIADDGMNRDPVSGNEIPPGSLAREVRDDVPAQLSDGEYVVPADVVRFFGVKYFEDLRMVAKQGLQQMEQDGRIGGEPMGSPAPQSADDALSPEEEALLQEIMAMEQQPQQQPPMQQQPQPSMAVGGVVKAAYGISVEGGGNLTEDIAIGGNKPKVTTGTDTGTTTTTTTGKDGMTSVFYIHPDGRRVKVLLLNGKPVGKVPDDFLDFVTDTPENRVKINFQVAEETPVGTGTTSSIQDNQDQRREPGGDLYQKPKPKTFEDIGINGSDPAAGADAALTQSAGLIMEGFTAIAPMGGAVIDSIRQAELISIAHANALFADRQKPLEDGTSVVGNQIRAQIEEYQKKNSYWLADVFTSVAAAFVKPGLNLLNSYDALGGLSAQTSTVTDTAVVVPPIKKEEKPPILSSEPTIKAGQEAANAISNRILAGDKSARGTVQEKAAIQVALNTARNQQEERKVALAEAKKIDAQTEPAFTYVSQPSTIVGDDGIIKQVKTASDKADEKAQKKAAEASVTAAMNKPKTVVSQEDKTTLQDLQKENEEDEDKGVSAFVNDDDFMFNRGGLIARPKKKTKKKKK